LLCVNKKLLNFFLLVFLCGSLYGEESTQSVSDISVNPQNVFDLSDPAQRNALFILANKLHITTRPCFIQRQLLFKKGEAYDPFLIYESERLLREYAFIRDASIQQTAGGGIRVDTRDAWSIIPQLSYGTEGGVETWSAGIKEKNLLGLGKTAAVYYKKELDRTYKEVYYEDPCFLYPHWTLGMNYQKDGDRKSHFHYISRRFYSSTTPWSILASEKHSRRSVKLYADGDEYVSWYEDQERIAAGAGVSLGSTPAVIRRIRGSFFKHVELFEQEWRIMPAPAAENRRMKGVQVSFEHSVQQYYKTQYVNTFDRFEDFNEGNEFFVSYGYSPEHWDSDKTRHIVKLSEQKGFRFNKHNAVFLFASGEGRVEKRKAQNFRNFYHIYHYSRLTKKQTVVTSLNFEQGINLDPEEQILLGGASGLRGYSVKQFAGNKKLLFNIEFRTFWLHDFLRLVSIGGILFFDSGFVWPEERNAALHDIRSDIGFGLRLDPTRGRGATPFNISLAYALNKNNENSRWVLTISGKPDLLNSICIPDEKSYTPERKY